MRFEVLTGVTVKFAFFLGLMPCSLADSTKVSEEVANCIFRVAFCTEHQSSKFLQNSGTCTRLFSVTLHKAAIKKKKRVLPTIAFAPTKYPHQFCVFMMIIIKNLEGFSDQAMDLTNEEQTFLFSKTSGLCLGSTQPPVHGKWASCSGCKTARAGS